MSNRSVAAALGAALVALGAASPCVAPAPAAGATAKSTRSSCC